eukprot:TRINITY_DN24382_c0_g1_i2.p1 TRINITY_DN24382_c0_g1~~TRINITY_DN24382_c0_g1_i2.p1  ORF type:complete len:179 (+),score=22.85 TRINITY_DN24382_c0_g1_i2:59-595(+)
MFRWYWLVAFILATARASLAENTSYTIGCGLTYFKDCDGCRSYIDGCNACACTSSGGATCDARYCREDEKTQPKCLDEGTTCVPRDIFLNELNSTGCGLAYFMDCEGCRSFVDGCNECTCTSAGSTMCTEMYCREEDKTQPKCMDEGTTCVPRIGDSTSSTSLISLTFANVVIITMAF